VRIGREASCPVPENPRQIEYSCPKDEADSRPSTKSNHHHFSNLTLPLPAGLRRAPRHVPITMNTVGLWANFDEAAGDLTRASRLDPTLPTCVIGLCGVPTVAKRVSDRFSTQQMNGSLSITLITPEKAKPSIGCYCKSLLEWSNDQRNLPLNRAYAKLHTFITSRAGYGEHIRQVIGCCLEGLKASIDGNQPKP